MFLEDLLADLRYGWRMLVRHPGFSLVAILALAIGIGANTAVFTVADAVLFRPPPFEHSERLHWIYDVNPDLRLTATDVVPLSPANFVDWRARNRSFDQMAAWRNWFFSVAGPEGHALAAEQVRGVIVSPAFFDMLGVHASLGRALEQADEEPGRDQVVVLTDGFWQRRFGGNRDIVGRKVLIDGRPFTVVGVLPPEFYFLFPDSAIFMPMKVDGVFRSQRDTHSIGSLARLAPGVARTEAMARQFWPGQEPIGTSIRVRALGSGGSAPWWPDQRSDTFTVVGIVGDIKERRLSEQIEPVAYLSHLQNPSRYVHLLVRTESAPASAAAVVQRAIRDVDADLGAYGVQTMETIVDQAVAEPKLNSLLLWVFAAIALLLSAVGVYGVMSYTVAQRTREFAIRMAIGAEARTVFGMVTREALAVALIGVAIGVGGALLLGRTLASLLYGVVPSDGSTLAGAAAVVLIVSMLACWRPAWRATRVDPMTVLRTE